MASVRGRNTTASRGGGSSTRWPLREGRAAPEEALAASMGEGKEKDIKVGVFLILGHNGPFS